MEKVGERREGGRVRERGRRDEGRLREEGRRGGREEGKKGRRKGEKCETLIFLIQQCIRILSKTRTQNVFDLHLTSSQSLLRLLSKRANVNLRLG